MSNALSSSCGVEVIPVPTGFPPGPHDWTFGLSQLRKMKQDVLGYYTELHRRYGDVVYLRAQRYSDPHWRAGIIILASGVVSWPTHLP